MWRLLVDDIAANFREEPKKASDADASESPKAIGFIRLHVLIGIPSVMVKVAFPQQMSIFWAFLFLSIAVDTLLILPLRCLFSVLFYPLMA